jgi:ADP-ribose pyrophosphatase
MIEKTLSTHRAFTGRMLALDVVEVELEPGVKSRREIVHHRGAVAVLARGPDGRFVFVRQYRKPMEVELTEIVAGCLEPGETPEQSARREVHEETGFAVKTLAPLGIIYPSAGYTDEVIHLFYAELEPSPTARQQDHDERITLVQLDAGEFERGLAAGEWRDAKTLAAWALFKRVNSDQC